MSGRFIVRPEAEADLDEAYTWYERRTKGLGARFLDAVGATFVAIQDSPQQFPELERQPDLVIRRALVDGFPYGVFFIWDVTESTVSVLACMHARRDPQRWLRRV